MAQGLFQRQSRHVNGARGTLTLWRQYKESDFFLCFCRQHSHEVAKQFGVIARYSYVFAYIQTDFQQEDFSGTGTTSKKKERPCQWAESNGHFSQRRKKKRSCLFSVCLTPACSCSVKQFRVIPRYSHVFPYIQRGFQQEDSSGTCTTSKAKRACHWNESNTHCTQRIQREFLASFCAFDADMPMFNVLLICCHCQVFT